MVDKIAEDICLSTRFLSLASDRLHAASKQELRNDMVKGEDKYPRTIAATLRFLQYHNLRGKQPHDKKSHKNRSETAFAQQGDEDVDDDDDSAPRQQKSKICGQWKIDKCIYKKKHTWKECPRNRWGINFRKEVDADGDLILCTVAEFTEAMCDDTDPALVERTYGEEGEDELVSHNTNNKSVGFYSLTSSSTVVDSSQQSSNEEHIFVQRTLNQRLGTMFAQSKAKINPRWILLDNQSTVDLFYNPDLLTDVKTVDDHITVHCNAGDVVVNMMGLLPWYGWVWFYPDGIANILSLFRVAQRFHVEYDSTRSGSFTVWKDDGSSREFKPGTKGLYYYDCDEQTEVILVSGHDNVDGITRVRDNLMKFNRRQVRKAEVARQLQNTAGLALSSLLRMIDSGALINSPVTRQAVKDSISIWGNNVHSMKGRTTRSTPDEVNIDASTIVPIPPYILDRHYQIVLCIDVMKVNKIPFLVSTSITIKFGTGAELVNMKTETMVDKITIILQIYHNRGFSVTSIAADNGFAPLRENNDFLALRVPINLTSQDEHQPNVERFIRTLKERARVCFAMIPFTKIPRRMVVELIYCQLYWYNFTIPEDYVSDRLGPGAIVLGRTYDFNKLCGPGTRFGEYVQTHEDTDNTMRERTVGAITLRPSGNVQGCFYYYSLITGRRLHRRKCTALPMPDEVIARIHSIADR